MGSVLQRVSREPEDRQMDKQGWGLGKRGAWENDAPSQTLLVNWVMEAKREEEGSSPLCSC